MVRLVGFGGSTLGNPRAFLRALPFPGTPLLLAISPSALCLYYRVPPPPLLLPPSLYYSYSISTSAR